MNTTEKELVIQYQTKYHDQAMIRLGKLNNLIESFKEAYKVFSEETEMPSLDIDTLKDVLSTGRRAIESRIDSYVAKQKKPLQKHYLETCFGQLAKLDPHINAFASWRQSAAFDNHFPSSLTNPNRLWITPDLKLKLDDAFFDSIRPLFQLSISNEVDLELWERYQALADAYNSLQAFAREKGVFIPDSFAGLYKFNGQNQHKAELVPSVFLPSIKKEKQKLKP